MTPIEFKAWFDGFTEAIGGTPNKDQWKRIKTRVAEIDGVSISERVFIDRYWPRYYPTWYTINQPNVPVYTYTTNGVTSGQSFNSTTSMYVLGQAEASGDYS